MTAGCSPSTSPRSFSCTRRARPGGGGGLPTAVCADGGRESSRGVRGVRGGIAAFRPPFALTVDGSPHAEFAESAEALRPSGPRSVSGGISHIGVGYSLETPMCPMAPLTLRLVGKGTGARALRAAENGTRRPPRTRRHLSRLRGGSWAQGPEGAAPNVSTVVTSMLTPALDAWRVPASPGRFQLIAC